jgi:3-phosphoinositide dependent protein kinase-1
MSQGTELFGAEGDIVGMQSRMSSPASTMTEKKHHAESGFGASDRSSRHHLSKAQTGTEDLAPKRNRFSKRQSRNGLGSAF